MMNNLGKKPGEVRVNFVVLRCKKCGREGLSFCPRTVKRLPECECGNKDFGIACRDWPNDEYGEFEMVGLFNIVSFPGMFEEGR